MIQSAEIQDDSAMTSDRPSEAIAGRSYGERGSAEGARSEGA